MGTIYVVLFVGRETLEKITPEPFFVLRWKMGAGPWHIEKPYRHGRYLAVFGAAEAAAMVLYDERFSPNLRMFSLANKAFGRS